MNEYRKFRKGNLISHPDGPYTFLGDRFTVIEDVVIETVLLDNSRKQFVTYALKDGKMETDLAESVVPIELSPMWLEKLGFIEGEFEVEAGNIKTTGVHYEKGNCCIHPISEGYIFIFSGEGPGEPMFYLHELQNFYKKKGDAELELPDF